MARTYLPKTHEGESPKAQKGKAETSLRSFQYSDQPATNHHSQLRQGGGGCGPYGDQQATLFPGQPTFITDKKDTHTHTLTISPQHSPLIHFKLQFVRVEKSPEWAVVTFFSPSIAKLAALLRLRSTGSSQEFWLSLLSHLDGFRLHSLVPLRNFLLGQFHPLGTGKGEKKNTSLGLVFWEAQNQRVAENATLSRFPCFYGNWHWVTFSCLVWQKRDERALSPMCWLMTLSCKVLPSEVRQQMQAWDPDCVLMAQEEEKKKNKPHQNTGIPQWTH